MEKFNRFYFGFTPKVLTIAWERIDKIKYVLTEPEEILELMYKLHEDMRNIREELAEYINSPIWNYPIFFYDEDEEYTIQYREYLKKIPDAVTTVLPTEEPEYSLSMGECEVTSEDESECDMPAKDESFLVFITFLNPLFDDNDDLTSSDDESLSEEEVPIEEFKVYLNPLFDDEEINSDKIDPHQFNSESEFVESLSNHDTLDESSSKYDYLEEFSGAFMPTCVADEERIKKENAKYISHMQMLFTINPCPRPMENSNSIIETFPSSPIPVQDGDSQREEINIFTKLLIDVSIPLPKNESSNSYHQDNPLFPCPPPEPSDVEFDLEPEVILAVINNKDELNEDECFDPGREIDVFANVKDDDYFPFTFVIRIFLPYLIHPEVSPLLLSTESKDTIFDPGISV
nr:hypothetical protein [Tanacetum cinerariifolium]